MSLDGQYALVTRAEGDSFSPVNPNYGLVTVIDAKSLKIIKYIPVIGRGSKIIAVRPIVKNEETNKNYEIFDPKIKGKIDIIDTSIGEVIFSLVGGVWLMYLLGYNMSVAVGVGFIALAGVAAETGVVMLIYLDQAYNRLVASGQMKGMSDLYDAIIEGAVERVRPKMMTVIAIMAGLLPIMWGTGTGSEVMKRIAAPMVGGMVSSTILTLLVIPAIYALWKGRELKRGGTQ
jgi:Cu(I)/Ag(I) efflux system membrane protein CusA/SilA